MKRRKQYTFMMAENGSSQLRQITLDQKTIRILLAGLLAGVLLLTAFVTDYFGLRVDKFKMASLTKENQELKQDLSKVALQLKDLEQRIDKISDFSRKLQMITNASEQLHSQMGFGKIHSNSTLIALSSSSPAQRNLAGLEHKSKDSLDQMSWSDVSDSEDLEVRIKQLKEKSELVKQSAWTLWTDLLEKQEILNNTPSIQPVKGWISSRFGYRNETIYSDHEPHFHRGVDIASVEGRPVVAPADGKVTYTGYNEQGYGNLVVIDHGYGLKTYYAHLAEIKTQRHKYVKRGEVIASVGSTGNSTGPHLHYEVRIFGIPVNPDNYILDQNNSLYTSL